MSWSNVNVLWQKKNENNTAASHSLTLVPISVQQNIGELNKKWKVVFHAQQNPNRTLSRANRAGIKLKRNKLKKTRANFVRFHSNAKHQTKFVAIHDSKNWFAKKVLMSENRLKIWHDKKPRLCHVIYGAFSEKKMQQFSTIQSEVSI